MVIGEQGLAALAFGTFQEEYEIEGSRQLEVGHPVEVDGSPLTNHFRGFLAFRSTF